MNIPWRSVVFAVLALCLCSIGTIATADYQEEPSYRGKSLSAYQEQLESANSRERMAAAEAIGRMGPMGKPAVPRLAEMIQNENEPIENRITAAVALRLIGPEAKDAVPALEAVAQGSDYQLAAIAQQSLNAIAPSFLYTIRQYTSSIYFLIGLGLVGTLGLAIFALARLRPSREEIPDRSQESVSMSPEEMEQMRVGPRKPAADTAKVPASVETRSSPVRKRVSKPLSNFDTYVHEEEGPESVKRALMRAQTELTNVSESQQALKRSIDKATAEDRKDELKELLRRGLELGSEHYRLEIHVKALEAKMIAVLMGKGTSDKNLQAKSEAAFQQRMSEIRTLCETPARVVWESGHWAHSPIAPTKPVPDIWEHLSEKYDVRFPDHVRNLSKRVESAETDEAAAPALEDEVSAETVAKVSAETVAEVSAETVAKVSAEIEIPDVVASLLAPEEPPVVEAFALPKPPFVVEESARLKVPAVVEEVPAAQEPEVEPAEADVSAAADEPAEADEVVAAEEPAAVEEDAPTETPPVVEAETSPDEAPADVDAEEEPARSE